MSVIVRVCVCVREVRACVRVYVWVVSVLSVNTQNKIIGMDDPLLKVHSSLNWMVNIFRCQS